MKLTARLDEGAPVILDGAIGTELYRRNANVDAKVWSARADAETLRAVHDDYIAAGAEIQTVNSFALARHVLEPAGLGGAVESYNRQAVELCRTAIDNASNHRERWIAGSLSTYAAKSDRSRLPGLGTLRRNYAEQAGILAEAGVDMLMLEMLFDDEVTLVMAESAATTGLPLCIGFTLRRRPDGETVEMHRNDVERGLPFEDVLDRVLGSLPKSVHTTIAIMHSEFDVTDAALEILRSQWRGPVAIYPNSGTHQQSMWRFDTVCSPDVFVSAAERWLGSGVNIIGGCCGVGPAHIKALAKHLTA